MDSNLREGEYLGKLLDFNVGASKQKKSPQISLRFALTHVQTNGQWTEGQTQPEVWVNVSPLDHIQDIWKKKLGVMGFGGDFTAPAFSKPDNVPLYARNSGQWGLDFDISTRGESDGGGGGETLDQPTLARLSAMYGDAVPAAPAAPLNVSATPDAVPAPPVGEISESDIPF